MLKLKKVEILGFKSFCERTELVFNGAGITAIVGPNGCGKSNISDAINWVLGEQSAKSLRGGSMQDVIFNGTRERQPTGLAEVTLTLLDTEYHQRLASEARAASVSGQPSLAALALEPASETERAPGEPAVLEGAEAERALHGNGHSNGHANGHSNGHTNGVNGHSNGHWHGKHGEVVISRRLYRSGESEYLLNGKMCRLRDIQEIFMGTGLGPDSYAIIEQGRVGQILNSKPYDRRALIEEAAGITKYKSKRRLAEAKLESSKQNLHRVNDILDEVGRQVSSLKRQASKARRYGELREEFRGKLRVAIASRYAELERQAMQSALELSLASARLKEMAAGVEALEQEHFDLNQASYEREEALRRQRDATASLAMEADRARNRIAYQRQQAAELETRLREDEAQHAQLKARLEALEQEQASAEYAVQAAEAENHAAQEGVASRSAELSAIEQTCREREQDRERQRGALMNVIGEINRLRNQLTQVEEYMAGLERQRERAEREQNAAAEEDAALREQCHALSERMAQQQMELQGVAAERAAVEARAAELKAEDSGLRAELEKLRAGYADVRARRDSLDQILSHHAYTGEAVKKLFSFQGDSFQPLGILADFIEVDAQFEALVEDFLAEELEYVVVKNWESAREGVRLLNSELQGRVTFLVEPDRVAAATRSNGFGFPHGLSPLGDHVRLTNGLSEAAHLALPKLSACYVVESPQAARDLALAHPPYFFLSPEGECFHGSTVTGGKRAGAGPLALKRELREVMQRATELAAATDSAETRLRLAEEESARVSLALERLRKDEVEREKLKVGSDQELKQLAAQVQRAGERLSIARLELERLQHESSRAAENAARLRCEAESRETAQRDLEQGIREAETAVAALAEARQAVSLTLSEARASAAALEERRRGVAAAAMRIADQVRHESARSAELLRQVNFARQELERLAADNEALEQRSIELARQKEAAEQAAAELKTALETGRQRLAELEEQTKAARAGLDAQRDQKTEREVALARQQSDMKHLAETCDNDLGTPVADLGVDPAELLCGDALAELEEQSRQLRARIEALGPVNMMALEEYQEMQQRFDFLNTQRQDLLDAIRDTQQTIQEMDVISRKQFMEAFEAINANFQATFRTLFGGGIGMMRLTEEQNPGDAGIDLIVQPPGKRLQNVLLMSGGEKALTAMALLLAIFRFRPSPFCVLDEVDAPLDDANIGRFTKMVLEMSLDTQFLIITHSKRTMEVAPVMYGVTMQEPGVSRLVSVKFHDAGDPTLPPPGSRPPTTVATA